jgi:(p)ppGpp synthase/HD superfamily hydrolase
MPVINSLLGKRFQKALVYATRAHATQFRKGTSRPYVAHLLGVAAIVLTHGGDEDEAIAALLHDAVEDQGGAPRLRDIRKQFGPRVARIVQDCSDTDIVPKPPWLDRKKSYLSHLRRANSSVRLISAADKLYNAQETLADFRRHKHSIWKRFHAGRDLSLWYYKEVVKILKHRGPRELVGELDRCVKELDRVSRPPRRTSSIVRTSR